MRRPRGKTAQLAAGGADVTALEASQPRLDRLNTNLQRLGLTASTILSDMMEWQTDRLFDCVLLDAPCSSTGTIRRHPDVQWSKSEQVVADLAQLQFEMVGKAAQLVKPGGILIFSNCSLDRAEGEDVYARILAGDFGLEADPIKEAECFDMPELINRQGALRTLPSHLSKLESAPDDNRMGGLDGFFCARFRRKT